MIMNRESYKQGERKAGEGRKAGKEEEGQGGPNQRGWKIMYMEEKKRYKMTRKM